MYKGPIREIEYHKSAGYLRDILLLWDTFLKQCAGGAVVRLHHL